MILWGRVAQTLAQHVFGKENTYEDTFPFSIPGPTRPSGPTEYGLFSQTASPARIPPSRRPRTSIAGLGSTIGAGRGGRHETPALLRVGFSRCLGLGFGWGLARIWGWGLVG